MQQLVVVQIVDLHRPPVFLEIGRRADHPLGRVGQLAGAQGTVLQIAHADRKVEAFADQLDIAVVQHHVHGDVGIFQQEIAQNRRQQVHPEICRHRNPQQARGGRLHGCDQRIGLARIVQHAAGAVVIGQSDLGRADAAGGAVQQSRPKARLKGRDVFRNGRFRNTHLLGRVSKAALVHHGGEGFHFSQSVHCFPQASRAG